MALNGSYPDPEISPVLSPGSSSFFPRTLTGGSNGYTSKVGFDTFQNPSDATLFSYTLQVKSEDYRRTRSTRSYLCAASGDESGSHALEWVMESLLQDGDELIVLRCFDGEDLGQMHEQRREEARELMKFIREKNDEVEPGRKVSIIVEFVGGKVTASIERLIALYRPDSLVVGTRGRTVLQQWGAAFGAPGVGSVSRYCVSRSPVPVIVVRPERKVRKGMQKRRADPKRGTHFEG
ncbi:adenine nucleotide alpha hydrolases-like protein [Ramaria rubella]|nr:adenine nucleotide alpha hydrolases-like protein [Ramaria rubella]